MDEQRSGVHPCFVRGSVFEQILCDADAGVKISGVAGSKHDVAERLVVFFERKLRKVCGLLSDFCAFRLNPLGKFVIALESGCVGVAGEKTVADFVRVEFHGDGEFIALHDGGITAGGLAA